MDGPSHYKEAERLLQESTRNPAAPALTAQAQVHALLALAAATAIGTTADARDAWISAAGPKPGSPAAEEPSPQGLGLVDRLKEPYAPRKADES